MNLHIQYMRRNDCFNEDRAIAPDGIIVHSTACPGVMAATWYQLWNKSFKAGETTRQVCVHAFLDDTGVWQYLPWDHRGWHAGGKANDSYIGFEICEPAGFFYENGQVTGYDPAAHAEYFAKAWDNAVELCVMLCRMYSIDPANIVAHCEGYAMGIASNHSDVNHWFPLHGKSMDDFRADVKAALLP